MNDNPKTIIDTQLDLRLIELPPEMHAEERESFRREYLDLIYSAFRVPAALLVNNRGHGKIALGALKGQR